MTRRDHGVVASLVLVMAFIVGLLAAPAFAPPAPTPTPQPVRSASPPRLYREGVVGRPAGINPLTAQSAAEDTLVGLVFSGLVALGPDDTRVPGLASEWSTSADGREWTFRIRANARWHDGEPVTAHDVAFTIGVLQDPTYLGPGGASWRDVTVTEVDPRTVRFSLTTPLGGFLQAATQPIVPAHLLEGVPVGLLSEHPFGQEPVGSGPYRLVSIDDDHAVLEPASLERADTDGRPGGPLVGATPRPSPSPTAAPLPGSTQPGIEILFYESDEALVDGYEAGDVDAAGALGPDEAGRLAALPGSRVLRYPTTTLTTVVFNLRPSRPEFREARVRFALLTAIDRAGIVEEAFGGYATPSDVPIPPASWAYDGTIRGPIAYDREAAARGLADAGWKAEDGSWTIPGASSPVAFELLSPDAGTNPRAFGTAAAIAEDWRRVGLDVTHVPLPPAELVTNRLRTGNFAAAVVDVNIGLDPDLYPLLASTQAGSQGLNLAGLQDAQLDALLVAARSPGTDEARRAAYRALQEALLSAQYVLPICFRDEVVVVRDVLRGPVPRPIATVRDRFWDVLTWRLAADR
jgi:peptide/nickel transport system substrate-binding protein